MEMTTYDAHGNVIDPHGARCARCGAPIKYVFEWEGKTYGSSCIETVSGLRDSDWVWQDGQPNLAKTRQRQAEQAQRQAEAEAREVRIEANRAYNAAHFADLIAVLRSASRYSGDFAYEMALNIEHCPVRGELCGDVLSVRQHEIVRDIYAKHVGGRRNSKAYRQAQVEFDTLYDEPANE